MSCRTAQMLVVWELTQFGASRTLEFGNFAETGQSVSLMIKLTSHGNHNLYIYIVQASRYRSPVVRNTPSRLEFIAQLLIQARVVAPTTCADDAPMQKNRSRTSSFSWSPACQSALNETMCPKAMRRKLISTNIRLCEGSPR